MCCYQNSLFDNNLKTTFVQVSSCGAGVSASWRGWRAEGEAEAAAAKAGRPDGRAGVGPGRARHRHPRPHRRQAQGAAGQEQAGRGLPVLPRPQQAPARHQHAQHLPRARLWRPLQVREVSLGAVLDMMDVSLRVSGPWEPPSWWPASGGRSGASEEVQGNVVFCLLTLSNYI